MLLKSFNEIDNIHIEKIHNAWSDRRVFIKNQISECIKNLIWESEALVYAIWSDGRKENMQRMSPWELLLFIKDDNKIRNNILMKCLNSELKESNKDTTMQILSSMEVQWPKYNNVYYYPKAFDEKYRIFFPTRFLDSHMLFWNEQINQEHKEKYLKDLFNISSWNQREWKKRIRLHKNISEKWENIRKNEIQKHFWKDEIFYNKDIGIENGVKLWPLRYLQYSIMKKIMEEKNPEMTDIFWKSTKEKLQSMKDIDLLKSMNDEDKKFITQAYYYFLNIHHTLQTELVKTRVPITYKFKSNTEKREFFDVLCYYNHLIEKYF